MTGPSAHLTFLELACRDAARTPYPREFIDDGRCAALAALFEAIRAAAGGPLTVLSAYRTPEHNRSRAVGGAPKSQHVQGRALDLRPPAGMAVAQFYALIAGRHRDGLLPGLGGIGRYRTFVHVDIRQASKLVAWSGGAQRKEDTETT